MRRMAMRFQFVVAALTLMLAAGGGLPGIVRALAPAQVHVCTCASGGSHASCPVCNHALLARRSVRPAVDGLPCGDRRAGTPAANEPVVVPSTCVSAVPPVARARAPRAWRAGIPERFLEPATPPPRAALPV